MQAICVRFCRLKKISKKNFLESVLDESVKVLLLLKVAKTVNKIYLRKRAGNNSGQLILFYHFAKDSFYEVM